MSLTTIKVDTTVRDRLADVARSRQTTMRALVADLADKAARDQHWAEINAAYARLQANPEQWNDYRADLDDWDTAGDDDTSAAEEWPEYQQ